MGSTMSMGAKRLEHRCLGVDSPTAFLGRLRSGADKPVRTRSALEDQTCLAAAENASCLALCAVTLCAHRYALLKVSQFSGKNQTSDGGARSTERMGNCVQTSLAMCEPDPLCTKNPPSCRSEELFNVVRLIP